ncbi:hypothetical protein SDC9_155693 [bioreactor metagenome]|uniref:Uncharacterized protein n=1 Tax=bioreactor metagenome TaxID=1076179 RepID=A0A645F2B3_9ZZZZ
MLGGEAIVDRTDDPSRPVGHSAAGRRVRVDITGNPTAAVEEHQGSRKNRRFRQEYPDRDLMAVLAEHCLVKDPVRASEDDLG